MSVWSGGSAGWRSAFDSAALGAVVALGAEAALLVPILIFKGLRHPEAAVPLASAAGVVLVVALTTLAAAVLVGAPVLVGLGRLGLAGAVPCALAGAALAVLPVFFANERAALEDPGFLAFMAMHGGLVGFASWRWSRRAAAT